MMNNKIIFLSLLWLFASQYLVAQNNYKTLIHEGNRAFNNKNFDKAASKYMDAIAHNDKDYAAHYNLGNALYKSEKYEEAKAEYQKAQQLSQTIPDKAAALYNMGNAHMKLNQPEKAAEFYKQSLKQDPYNESVRKNYEIAKLKEKENQQKEDQQKEQKEGKDGGNDQQKGQNEKGDGEQKKDQGGNGQQNQQGENGEGDRPDQNNNGEGSLPKEVENQILDRVGQKEKETARKVLNKESYSMPASNEKDW